MNRLVTEREWLQNAYLKKKSHPECWGAQYILADAKKHMQRRLTEAFFMTAAILAAVLLPLLIPHKDQENISVVQVYQAQTATEPRSVSSISYQLPQLDYRKHICTQEELMRGKLLLLDQAHPLPSLAPPPNTFSIASYGRGMVPVQSLHLQSGKETIEALMELFQAMRLKGVSNLTVIQATQSRAQMKAANQNEMRKQMKSHAPDEAGRRTLEALNCTAQEELLQEYTVELSFMNDTRALTETENGQKLLQTAWRHGFVRTHPDADARSACLFRYVGKAHATAMTYLDLDLAEYLDWLHQKGVIAIQANGRLQYLILCQPMTGTHTELLLPAEAVCEVSADQLGYAIAACTM